MLSKSKKGEFAMLDEATLKLVTDGFADMKSTVSQVLTVAIPAIIGIICLSRGVNYALSKVSGVLGWA